MTSKYTEMRKQTYELAKSLSIDVKTMGGRRVGRGIDGIAEDFLPMIPSDLKELKKRLGIKNYKLR